MYSAFNNNHLQTFWLSLRFTTFCSFSFHLYIFLHTVIAFGHFILFPAVPYNNALSTQTEKAFWPLDTTIH